MSRDHFWRSISRDTNVKVSASSPLKCDWSKEMAYLTVPSLREWCLFSEVLSDPRVEFRTQLFLLPQQNKDIFSCFNHS